MTRTFYIRTDPMGTDQWFWFILRVYKKDVELRRAAVQYVINQGHHKDQTRQQMTAFFERCNGCFHGRVWFLNGDQPKRKRKHEKDSGYIGVMRLAEESMTTGIAIHESVHAAVALVLTMSMSRELHIGNTEQQLATFEEPVCYATQEISQAVLRCTGLVPA